MPSSSGFETKRRKRDESTAWEPNDKRAAPNWYYWIPSIIEKVEKSRQDELYSRDDIESLFGVTRSTAARIMHRVGATRYGAGHGRLLIAQPRLLSSLRSMQSTSRFRDRVQEQEDRFKRIMRLRTRRIFVQTAEPEPEIKLSDLPATIELDRNHCTIRCSSLEDLLRQLVTLARLLTENYEEVESFFSA
jgi:hypothetical protein